MRGHGNLSLRIFGTLAAILLFVPPARAVEPSPELGEVEVGNGGIVAFEPEDLPLFDFQAEMQNLFLFRNDSDFDRTTPYYNANGQTLGAFATVFRPSFTINVTDRMRMFYQAEIGLNYWSKHNPDQEDALAKDVFVMKHRELWASGEIADEQVGFKVGYQYFRDPSGLFLAHWIGAAQAWWNVDTVNRVGLFIGQIPDQVHEGIDVRENNFKRDILVFGARTDLRLARRVYLSAGVYDLFDSHVVGRTRWVVAPVVHLDARFGKFSTALDGVFQYGRSGKAARDGSNQTILAWAAQAHGTLDFRPFEIDLNLLALSPDDAYEGNSRNGAFLASAKNRSATMLLTEDEVRDWYDNLDERMSTYGGGFFENRAGLLVADVKARWSILPEFRPAVILGAATVLQPKNALGGRLVGIEAAVDLGFHAGRYLEAHLLGGALLPGKAGAALVNRIDLDAKNPIFSAEASLMVRY
jgi:hypothetical protein